MVNPSSSNQSKFVEVIEQTSGWWLVRFEDDSQREYLPDHIQTIQSARDAEAALAFAAGPTATATPATGPTATPSRAGKSRSTGALPLTRLVSTSESSNSAVAEPDPQDADMAPPESAPVSTLPQLCADAFRIFEVRNQE